MSWCHRSRSANLATDLCSTGVQLYSIFHLLLHLCIANYNKFGRVIELPRMSVWNEAACEYHTLRPQHKGDIFLLGMT